MSRLEVRNRDLRRGVSKISTLSNVLGNRGLQSNCITLIQKGVHLEMGDFASPGLTVLRRRGPAPPGPAQADMHWL